MTEWLGIILAANLVKLRVVKCIWIAQDVCILSRGLVIEGRIEFRYSSFLFVITCHIAIVFGVLVKA